MKFLESHRITCHSVFSVSILFCLMQRQIVRKPRSLNPSLCCSWRGDGHRVVDAVPDERPVRGAALHAAPAPAAREGSRDVELVEVEPEHDAVSRVTCLTMRHVSRV